MLVLVLGAALGCGLFAASCLVSIPDVVDGSADGGSNDAVPLPDVSASCDGACGAPAGFTPVLFALDQNTACPSSMTTLNTAADPSLGAACACGCALTGAPTCLPVSLQHDVDQSVGDAGLCSSLGVVQLNVDGGCNTVQSGAIISPHWRVVPPAPLALGSCTNVPANNPDAASVIPARICVDSTCASSCSALTGFKTCFLAAGKATCPAAMTAHQVGNVSVTCGTCSACSVTTDAGCGGSLALYSDMACTAQSDTVPVNNVCTANATQGTLGSVRYTPTPPSVTCNGGTSSGTVSLQQQLTVCCP